MIERRGVSLHDQNPFGVTPLHCAARQGFNACITYLCERPEFADASRLKEPSLFIAYTL